MPRTSPIKCRNSASSDACIAIMNNVSALGRAGTEPVAQAQTGKGQLTPEQALCNKVRTTNT